MAIVEVSLTPLGTEGASVAGYVAEALRALEQSGLRYELHAMGTIIEGDLEAILVAIRRMQEAIFAMGAPRVSTLIKIDDRRDKTVSIEDKVRVVEELLAKQHESN